MAIRNLHSIKDRSQKFQDWFLRGCTVEEKIDGHFVTMQIVSKNTIVFFKSNKNKITRSDMILNSMWKDLVLDWNVLMFSNKEYIENHIGWKFNMFFLPFKKSINTEYKEGIKYIISSIEFNGKKQDIQKDFFDLIDIQDNKIVPQIHDIRNGNKIHLENVDNYLNIDFIDKSKIYASDVPEGLIFRNGKELYKIMFTAQEKIDSRQCSYEWILKEFLNFTKTCDYVSLLSSSYSKSVCNLFEAFIDSVDISYMEENVFIEELEAPYVGVKPKMNYEYIPSERTKIICKSGKIYENIFKILLANLQRRKNWKKSEFLSKQQCEELNTVIFNIGIRTSVD